MTGNEKFQYCLTSILEHEGGLTLDKQDKGGATNWGISLRYLKSIGLDINGDGEINELDIIHLPVQGASDIYRKYWWDRYMYEKFKSILVAEKVFDMAVNMGAVGAHKLLQKAINALSKNDVIVDGLIGSKTYAEANILNPEGLRDELRTQAAIRYKAILKANPDMEVFRKGWLRRAAW